MPTHMRAQCSWQLIADNPSAVVAINPCFRAQVDITDPIGGPGWQQLADDLKTGLAGWAAKAEPLTVKLYQIGPAKPNPPKAISKTVAPSAPSSFVGVPQQAVCLSYYSGENVPRKRGRLYIPAFLTTQGSAVLAGTFIDTSIRDKVDDLVGIFAGLGGTNVDWIVWSSTGGTAAKVTDWWIDDSWDIVRSRKLPATSRVKGTTGG